MALIPDASSHDHSFVERRSSQPNSENVPAERRQFGNSHFGLSPDALELAKAIDDYKLKYRRRFITCEEMLSVILALGYAKRESAAVPEPAAVQ